ncbi:MFS transporter [Rhodothermus marinus]|uniref:MFS transporter n=1 Tax=Rhodothermus marinus TaxID=29549 RepID=UPI000B01EEE1
MKRFLGAQLSAMMFLEFFYLGRLVYVGGRLHGGRGHGHAHALALHGQPDRGHRRPVFPGPDSDRYFATEKVLGVLHLLGGLVLLLVPQFSGAPVAFILLLLLYNLCYMPTLGLANSLAFHHIQSQEKQFPLIRVFGTIGWIVAGLFVSFVLKAFVAEGRLPEQTPLPLYTAAVASILLGLYSFTLPHTPPPAAGQRVSIRSIVGLDALERLGSKPFYVFLVSSFLICIPLAAYYNFTQLFLEATVFRTLRVRRRSGRCPRWSSCC